MSNYLTHNKRLREPDEPLSRFFAAFEPIKRQMGPVLIQLPPSLKFDNEIARNLFETLKTDYAKYYFALEARHSSWLEKESIDLLAKYKLSFVISQSNNLFPYAEHVTAKNIYLRLHGPQKLFASAYTEEDIRYYAAKIAQWQKSGHHIWVFFNNTATRDAINNAFKLKELLTG